VAAMLLLTLRGTPTLYYGDELGMTDVPIPTDEIRDPYAHRAPSLGVGRDPQRTPMQWNADAHAGFCPPDAKPWLPVSADYQQVNVAAQDNDKDSMLTLYRRLLALRRENIGLTAGSYQTIQADNGVLTYARQGGDQQMLVALNLTGNTKTVALTGRVRLSTRLDREEENVSGRLHLRPNEGAVLDRKGK
jgi:alpha-glucosidase